MEKWQEVRFGRVCGMGQIFASNLAILTAVCSKEGAVMAMERLTNFSDEVTEGRSSVTLEEERVERDIWIVNM